MIMYLKQIITKNIQSHGDVVIDLPPTGLIIFTGDNSNGKSVIVKTTRIILSGQLKKPRKRASLVNRDAMFGDITYIRSDDVKLTVHITREAATVYFKYEVPGEEPIVRYLADKSYEELARKFGWHYDPVSGISLNLAEGDDALLFYKTSNKVNGSVLETATSDTVANNVAEVFEEQIKEIRSYRDQWIQQQRTYATARNGLLIEDTEPLKIKAQYLEKYLGVLSTVYFPNIPEIHAVPKVRYTSVHKPTLPTVKYPKFINVCVNIPDITPVASELKTLREHRCPTCGRGFDCGCENSVS